ncbi:MAG: GNAT family protein [Burkholderiales bacterium]|nr:GNAT family protein [Burkholderiales bacterium]
MSNTSGLADLPIGDAVSIAPALRPERTELAGRFVRLVPLDPPRHAADLFAATHGPDEERRWWYLGDGPYRDRAAFAAALVDKAASQDPLFFAVIDAVSGKACGYQTLMRIDAPNRVVEVGNIVYGRTLQRTPASTEAQFLFMRHAFDTLGYRRYEWKCNALNAPSRAAALRFGFTFEGVFRSHMIMKGRNRDTAWYSIIEAEWPSRRAAFEAWLAPDNFDATGGQRRRLEAFRH